MEFDKRNNIRFNDIGKVEAPEVCHFPGVLVDISKHGCRVRFPVSFLLDTDNDYELKIFPVRHSISEYLLIIAHPVWQTNNEDSTEIGFTLLHSPSTKKYDTYIEKLLQEKKSNDFEQELLDGIK